MNIFTTLDIKYPMHQLNFYEDCIELKLPVNEKAISVNSLNWVRYNPRKEINRFACSITSLDGNDNGVPDLDSLLEYNKISNTNYTEKDFKIPTRHSEPFKDFLSLFTVGRSHYLKLEPGGFFPWHRDSDPVTFRIIYTVHNCNIDHLIWLEDNKVLPLRDGCWYYINTRKKHALFSFSQSIMAVFNVVYTAKTLSVLQQHMSIK